MAWKGCSTSGLFPTHGPLHRGEGTYGLARPFLPHPIIQTTCVF
jgi:hypothetical protein